MWTTGTGRCHETDRGSNDRRHGQLDHLDADCYSNLVFYLEALDYAFRVSDRQDRRQPHIVRTVVMGKRLMSFRDWPYITATHLHGYCFLFEVSVKQGLAHFSVPRHHSKVPSCRRLALDESE